VPNRARDPGRDVRPVLGHVGLDTPLRGYSTSMGWRCAALPSAWGAAARHFDQRARVALRSARRRFLLIE